MFGCFKKLLLSRSDENAFRPALKLIECFDLANAETYTRSHGFIRNRAHRFFSEQNRTALVSKFLSERFGLANFQYVGCGDNAVVVRYTEFQALRFRAPAIEDEVNTQRVLQSPFICPIWREIDFQGARLNFVPYIPSLSVAVSTGVISRELAEQYMFALLRVGFENNPPFWFYDYKNFAFKFEQAGLLFDGTPIIIDQGSVILESDAPKTRLESVNEDKRHVLGRSPSFESSWDGSWLDSRGSPKIEQLPKPDERIMAC